MTWRVAKSLIKLREQFDALAPNRDTDNDGTIGDTRHQASVSDHNPDDRGIVHAMDISHDPGRGVDTWQIADQLRLSRDRRIKYIISNSRIASSTVAAWQWRPYYGANPHDHHMHISVTRAGEDDMAPWQFHLTVPGAAGPVPRATIRKGSTGYSVELIQRLLEITLDGQFGPDTEQAVIEYQKSHGLVPDGVVGPATWGAIEADHALLP